MVGLRNNTGKLLWHILTIYRNYVRIITCVVVKFQYGEDLKDQNILHNISQFNTSHLLEKSQSHFET